MLASEAPPYIVVVLVPVLVGAALRSMLAAVVEVCAGRSSLHAAKSATAHVIGIAL